MRFVALWPHPEGSRFTDDAADGVVGKPVPFTVNGEGAGEAIVRAARVDRDGMHLEIEVEPPEPARRQLHNLVWYGSPHGPREMVPTRPEFSIAGRTVVGEPDPLLAVGCVQPSSALDDHRNRDALREIVKAATERFRHEQGGA